MRRPLLAPIIGAIVLLGSMLPATALGSVAGMDSPGVQAGVAGTATTDLLAYRIRLGCTLVSIDAPSTIDPAVTAAIPAVKCRWSAVDSPRVAVYQLWRVRDIQDGGTRRLVARRQPGDPLRYLDTRVKAGHAYTYKVVARAASGRKIASSALVTVRIPRPDEVLRMACALGSAGDRTGVICKWSAATDPRAAGYVLWRSVDGAARERIYRTGLDGRRGFIDTDVKPGQTIRYAVIVVNRHGHKVGKGGPVVVSIPNIGLPPGDPVVTGAR